MRSRRARSHSAASITATTNGSGVATGIDLVGDPFAGVSHTFHASGTQWVNPAVFVPAAPGSLGNLGRNKFTGPGYASVDFSVFKNFQITERQRVHLAALRHRHHHA